MTLRKKEAAMGAALAAPFLVGFLTFYVVPLFISLFLTVTSDNRFVGLENYAAIFQSAAFRLASWNTFRFIAVAVPLIMAVSFVLSLLLYQPLKGISVLRSVFLLPLILPIASTVMVFQVFLSNGGVLNSILTGLHLQAHDWLHSGDVFGVLVFLYIWKNSGYNIILFLAGLHMIPREFQEVARLEGASPWKSFRYITMPLMVPHFFFVFVISIMNSFKSFREAFLLNGNHPQSGIYMLQNFMNNNFSNLNYQRLSVAAFLIFSVIFGLVLLLFLLRRKAGDYEL